MNKRLNISIDELFSGLIFFEEQTLHLISITDREAEKQDLEELHERILYYSNSISDYLVRTRDVFPESIAIDVDLDLTVKGTLDALSEFCEAIVDLATDEQDKELQDMSEDLLGAVNQCLLNSSLAQFK